MFRKVLLLSFALIAIPSYTVNEKAEGKRKLDDICNILDLVPIAGENSEASTSPNKKIEKKTDVVTDDRISDLLSSFLVTLATDPKVDTVLDDTIDSLAKFSTFIESVDDVFHGINKLIASKENKQWGTLFNKYFKSVEDKTMDKIIKKISQLGPNDKKRLTTFLNKSFYSMRKR